MSLAKCHAGDTAGDEACQMLTVVTPGSIAQRTCIDGIKAAKEVGFPWSSACWARIAQDSWLGDDFLDAVGPVRDIVVVNSWRRSLGGHIIGCKKRSDQVNMVLKGLDV
jgi:hypothetical protein